MVTQAWSSNQSMQLFSSMPEDLLTNEATDRSFALLNLIVASLRVFDYLFFSVIIYITQKWWISSSLIKWGFFILILFRAVVLRLPLLWFLYSPHSLEFPLSTASLFHRRNIWLIFSLQIKNLSAIKRRIYITSIRLNLAEISHR